MSAAAAEQQQQRRRQGETNEEEVISDQGEYWFREQRPVHPSRGIQHHLLHLLFFILLLFRLLWPRWTWRDQHLYLHHRPRVVHLEPGTHLSGPSPGHAARPSRPHQRLLHAALRVVLHHRGDALLPGVVQPDSSGVRPGLPSLGVRLLLQRRRVRLVSGAHAFPSPPAPAQPHDRQLHVGTPSPPHRPDIRAPPPSPPPTAPPPGIQRARSRLQLHRLSGLQRADSGFRLETQLQRLRLFGLQRPGLVAFPSAVTSCVCLLLRFQRSILFVVGGLFLKILKTNSRDILKTFICEKKLRRYADV